jgi:hypothetical protein
LGVSLEAWVTDVLDILKDLDPNNPRLVWPCHEFRRRASPERELTLEKAGAATNTGPLYPEKVRKGIIAGKLPAHKVNPKGFKVQG